MGSSREAYEPRNEIYSSLISFQFRLLSLVCLLSVDYCAQEKNHLALSRYRRYVASSTVRLMYSYRFDGTTHEVLKVVKAKRVFLDLSSQLQPV